MAGLSEVSTLFGQRAGDLDKGRRIFISEIRHFTEQAISALKQIRSTPWVNARVRLDLPREIDFDKTQARELTGHFASGRVELRFKKETKFVVVAEITFGFTFDEDSDGYAWQITLIPSSKYPLLDDKLWNTWKTSSQASAMPGATRHEKASTVGFVSRALDAALSPQTAFNDVKHVLDFLLGSGATIADAVGIDLTSEEREEPNP